MVKNKEDSKIWAFLGVFLTLIGFILVLLLRKEDKYAMHYGKIGLVLFIGWVAVSIVGIVPVVGWLISVVGGILMLIAWIVGIVYAFSGEMKRIPVVSDIADKINL